MAPKLSMASLYPYLAGATGYTDPSMMNYNPIEAILSRAGLSPTSGITTMANTGAIGADNGALANSLSNNTNTIFSLVQNSMQKSNQRAAEEALKRAQAEAEAKAAAMQARLLKAQKDAALSAVKNMPNGSGSGSNGSGSNGIVPIPNTVPNTTPLIPMPKLPKAKTPKNTDQAPIVWPKAKPRKIAKRDPRKPGIQN